MFHYSIGSGNINERVDDGGDSRPNIGAAVGGTIAAVIVVVVFVLSYIFFRRRYY